MKNPIHLVVAMLFLATTCVAQTAAQDLNKLGTTVKGAIKKPATTTKTTTPTTTTKKTAPTDPSILSNGEVIDGLKQALTIGANNSTTLASKVDGYYKNPALFIPFPPDAEKVKEYANKVGLKAQVDKFELTLNRAAEEAAKNAAPIFVNAVKGMSITDGFSILKGADNAATQYLKDKTTPDLLKTFKPIVQAAITKVQLTKYWSPIITSYNKVPLVQKQNPDLAAYVTDRAIQGLFKLIADEELKIRKDPAAQVTDLLKKVFNWGK